MNKASLILPALLVGGVAHGKLAYTRSGQGPGIVLLHSLGGTHEDWHDEIARLQERHTVIAVDLPGHGGSPAPAAVNFDAIARDVAAVIRAEKLAPAIVVGHSMGGTIAGHVPVVDVGAARAVVIVDSTIGALPLSDAYRNQLRADVARDHDGTMRTFYARICRPDQLERIMKSARQLNGATWVRYLDAAATQPVADGGRAIAVPLLLLASRILVDKPEDQPSMIHDAGFEHVADLTVTRFDTLHWIAWERPAEFDAALDAFFARVEHAHR